MFTSYCKNALVPLLLRLTLATIFIYHGLDLVYGLDFAGGRDPDKQWGAHWDKRPDAPPAPLQLAVAWGQLIGGIALAFGFLTRLAALGIIAIMVGAIVTVHWQHGFDNRDHGFEYNFAIIMMCVCLILGGPGPFAVDRFFGFRRKQTG